MKIIELGRGLRAIVPDPDRPADSIRSFTTARLKRAGASDDLIRAYKEYIRRTSEIDYSELDDEYFREAERMRENSAARGIGK